MNKTAERFDRRRHVDATVCREFASSVRVGSVSGSALATAIDENIHRAYIEVMI
jgi:hypothetical protein